MLSAILDRTAGYDEAALPDAPETNNKILLDSLFGSELITEYRKALNRYHWESPQFDCSIQARRFAASQSE